MNLQEVNFSSWLEIWSTVPMLATFLTSLHCLASPLSRHILTLQEQPCSPLPVRKYVAVSSPNSSPHSSVHSPPEISVNSHISLRVPIPHENIIMCLFSSLSPQHSTKCLAHWIYLVFSKLICFTLFQRGYKVLDKNNS